MNSATVADYNWTHLRSDPCHIEDDLRVTTGAGRYVLGTPANGGNGVFVPEPTTRMQRWGASQITSHSKTDVESDLWNINRPGTKAICGSYDPAKNRFNSEKLTNMPEASFTQTAARLNDPPVTLRGTGWNRWEYLCQNPQENVMVPFDWFIPGRQLAKDSHKPLIPKPTDHATLMPSPLSAWPNQYNSISETFPSVQKVQNVAPAPQKTWSSPTADVECPVPTGPPSVAWKREARLDINFANSLPRTAI